jgi:hypothetical protein
VWVDRRDAELGKQVGAAAEDEDACDACVGHGEDAELSRMPARRSAAARLS